MHLESILNIFSLRKAFPNQLLYKLWLSLPKTSTFELRTKEINSSFTKSHSDLKRLQQKETIKRYQFINDVLKQGLKVDSSVAKDFRSKLDRVLTHRI
jgi:ferrous iron transport protein B